MGTVPDSYRYRIFVGPAPLEDTEEVLVIRPKNISVGLGAHREVTLIELEDALEATLARSGLSRACLGRLASIDRRQDSPALGQLAAKLGLDLVWFTARELAGQPTPNPSALVAGRVATPSVCEAAALLNWPNAQLIVEKTKWPNLTLAVALSRPRPGSSR